MAKMVLDMSAMQDREFSDTALIGISAPLAPYRFCHEVNTKLGMDFVRNTEMDVVVQDKKESYTFHYFEYILPLNGGVYTIYKLKSGSQSLLPELKQLDYLLKVERAYAEEEAEDIIQLLLQLPEVQLAQLIPSERLKNLGHLMV